jgi:hypothetical protein
MADVEAADASGKIDEAVAVDVIDDRAFRSRGKERRGVIRAAGNGGFAAGHKDAGLGAGDFGAKLDGRHFLFSLI